MSNPEEAPVEIEPLTKAEKAKRASPVEETPEFPADWKGRSQEFADAIDKGFKYYRRNVDGKLYMVLRKRKTDKGLGAWDEEKEAKLFHYFPNLETMGGIPKPPLWSPSGILGGGTTGRAGHLGIPIARTAIIPRDYVPSINVIRYFQLVKENGFPGDFSQFLNEIVLTHMKHCRGIGLEVVIEQELEEAERRLIEIGENPTAQHGKAR